MPENTPRDNQTVPPIFLLTCYRSGSTLLRMILDTHPEIYAPPELLAGNAAGLLSLFYCGLEGAMYDPAKFDQPPFPQIFQQVRKTLGDPLDAAAAKRGKRTWCEKSPSNLSFPQLYETIFPEARLICLYRHPLDFLASLLQYGVGPNTIDLLSFLGRHQGNRLRAFTEYWNDRTQILLNIERRFPERSFRVRYEDLARSPQEVLPPLLAFLGVAPQPDLHERVFSTPHDVGLGDPNIHFTRQIHRSKIGTGAGLSLDDVSPEHRELQEKLLQELGYPRVPEPEEQAGAARNDEVAALPIHELFEQRLAERLRQHPEVGQRVGTLLFVLEGEGGGTWMLRDGRIGPPTQAAEPAPAHLRLGAADFRELLAGRVSAAQLVMAGRLRAAGVADHTLLQLAKLL